MEPISKQYQIGQEFQLCSITQLGFAPRDGYQFSCWIDNDGNIYNDQSRITVNSQEFQISAIWDGFSEVIPIGDVISSNIVSENENNKLWWM